MGSYGRSDFSLPPSSSPAKTPNPYIGVFPSGGKEKDCVDPDVFNIGPEYFSHYATEKNIPLSFGIDPKLMSDGSPKEIRERILNYTSRGYPTRGLTVRLMHIPFGTPERNIRTAVETVKNFNQDGNRREIKT